uniref:Uncharacterized protein n=1 Tax=Solanum lycopersicum TaxID=4081 RepID=K4DGF7_SOLLC
MVDIISKGVHSYNMTCAYLESVIGKCNAGSATTHTHRSWRVCISWVTFALANVKQCQPRHVHFLQVKLANGKKQYPRPARLYRGVTDIYCGLPASVKACANLLVIVSVDYPCCPWPTRSGLLAWVIICPHCLWSTYTVNDIQLHPRPARTLVKCVHRNVTSGMENHQPRHAHTDVFCADISSNVGQGLAIACTHRSWRVCISWVTFALANVKQCQPRHVRFLQVKLANGKKQYPSPACLYHSASTFTRRH